MRNNRYKGKKYEELAVSFLVNQGLKILEQNYYCKTGELDIIAYEDDYLVFIEVKYRSNDLFGEPSDSVNMHKQRKLKSAANMFILDRHISDDISCRFDVIAITGNKIEWLKDVI